MKSRTLKWILIVVLVVIGIVAVIVGIEYLTSSISKLPSWLPGKRHVHGHYHKRGYGSLLVAIIAFALAGWLAVTIRREGQAGNSGPGGSSAPPVAAPSATDLMSGPTDPPPAPAGG